MNNAMRSVVLAAFLVAASALWTTAVAQTFSGTDPYLNRVIETVTIRVVNPSNDAGLNARVEDSVRRRLSLFPGARFSQQLIEFQVAQARRVRDVGDVAYEVNFGRQGGLDVAVTVTLATVAVDGRGMVFGDAFPVVYEKDGSLLSFKLDLFNLYFGNNNAWYGDPDAMLAGNPLVQGQTSGEGWDDWLEGYAHYGAFGITPVTDNLYVYGALSGITSFSVGQELFTDKTRTWHAVEDAYVGVVGGNTDAAGNRLAFNLSAGRQRFTLANGFLIATTSANGEERAALQANARWAADFLGHARLRYDKTMVEAFYVDPDELPVLDTGTKFAGVNLEFEPVNHLRLAVSYVTSPESEFNYFGPTGQIVGTREGLRVWDARFNYSLNGPGAPGPFFGGEYARQTNENFDMDARGGWAEAGYSFPGSRWSPTVSYRYGHFTGDDPETETFERWDPMLSGLNGEAWIQSSNHFKLVQNSNVISHRLQALLRPSPKIELVPQLWAFFADSKTNVGGNPALGFLQDDEYAYEAMITAKWFVSRKIFVQGHIAHTWPGKGAKLALDDPDDWTSVMLFARYAF